MYSYSIKADSPVTPALHLYIDDSGSRDLDKHLNAQDGSKWFALGGVLVAEEDEAVARASHAAFCARWSITAPLHSYDIRQRVGDFAWLNTLPEPKLREFFDDLTDVLMSLPVVGVACVIDRQGYNARYRERYGRQRWALCKTAFTIVTERTAKYAQAQGRRLRVYYERSDKHNERKIESYFADMRSIGMPFDQQNSAKYGPLEAEGLKHTLWECRKKQKSSPLMQIADLLLFPICVGGYDPAFRPFAALRAKGMLIDCVVGEELAPTLGVKYSCFDAR